LESTQRHLNRPPANRGRAVLILLVGALLLGGALRIVAMNAKFLMTNDEGWSYLAAACREGDYESRIRRDHLAPYGVWASAGEWRGFLQPAETCGFRTISNDIAQWDVHPPLYFWLLHLFVLVFGPQFWTGPLLNLFLDAGTAWLIFIIGRRAFDSDRLGVAASLIWLVSPAVLAASWEARTYPLVMLLSTGLFLIAASYALSESRRRVGHLIGLAVLTCLGMLTHYHFAIALAGCCLLLAWRLLPADIGRLALACLAVAIGCVSFIAIHPEFYLAFGRMGPKSFTLAEFVPRSTTVLQTLSEFLVQYERIPTLAVYLVFALLAVAAVGRRWRSNPAQNRVDRAAQIWRSAIVWQGAWILLCVGGLYIAGASPVHAMGSKYLSLVWPFFALGLVIFALQLPGSSRAWVATFCVLIAAFGAEHATRWLRWADGRNDDLVRGARSVVIDSVHPGILPRLSFYLGEDQPLLAADQHNLIAHPEVAVKGLQAGGVLISVRAYANTTDGTDQLVDHLRKHHRVEDAKLTLNGTGRIFFVHPLEERAEPSH
jgi:hypothetical protein